MSCLCSKLKAESFDRLTSDETLLLLQTFAKAPQLFHSPASSTNPDPRSHKKKRRRKSTSEILYPNTEFQELLKEYGEAWRLTPSSFLDHWDTKHDDVIVRLYVAVERIDRSNSTSKLVRRTLCLALTELHEKRTKIDDLVSRVHSSKELETCDRYDIRKKFYGIFKAGAKWKHIIAICAETATRDRHENISNRAFSGVLWLLGKGKALERASEDDCTKTIADLGERTDLFAQSKKVSSTVNSVLDYMKANISFSSQSFNSAPKNLVQPSKIGANEGFLPPDRPMRAPVASANQSIGKSRICRCHNDVRNIDIRAKGLVAMNRRSYSTTEIDSSQAAGMPDTTVLDWKVGSEAVVLHVVPALQQYNSQEISLLLVLLCFLKSSQLTTELLWRGSTPQKRWSRLGERTEVGAFEICLDRDLSKILSDHAGLRQLFQTLEAAHIIRMDSSTGMAALDQQVVARVTNRLPQTIRAFWMHQALLIAIQGFPRKYLEPKYRQIAKLHLPHLQHTLKEFGDCEYLNILSNTAMVDLILSLVEASRFSDVNWKRHAIALAKKALQQDNDSYLHACVAQRDCAISRTSGNIDRSALALSSFRNGNHPYNDPRMNAELGQLTLQSAINHIHNEELAKAIEELRSWQPLNATSLSTAERITLYHIYLWQGKVLRYQGQFFNSLVCLQSALSGIEHESSLEDARARLICELSDVYCELADPIHAEHLLEAEIKRLEDRGKKNSTDWYLLQLSRAESLWGQHRFEEAEALSFKIQSSPHLSKLDELRLSTLFGRIYYVRCDWSNARHYWTKALSDIAAYPLVNGHTSRVILYSMQKVLLQEGNLEWSTRTKDQIKKMKVIKPGGCEYWIPGLGKWYHYLTAARESL